MKRLFFVILILGMILSPVLGHAQSDFGFSRHSVYGAVGFTAGGVALGADYEYNSSRSFGIGGYVRMYQKDDENPGQSSGLTTFGGFIRPHFTKKDWDLYVSPGLGIMSIDAVGTGDDSTTLGASLAIGLLYDINGKASIGAESMSHHVWFEEDYRGQILEDLMVKFRMAF